MNCSPGDLAVIVTAPSTPENIGRIVRCIRIVSDDQLIDGTAWSKRLGGPTWLVESEGQPLSWRVRYVKRRAFADRCLRPIRDTGDDARDESAAWPPPVPTRTKEAA